MKRTYTPKPCARCCTTFTPTGPRSVYCSDDCRDAEGVDRELQRGYDADGKMTRGFAGAIAAATLHVRNRQTPIDLTLPGLGQIAKHVVEGKRAKDRGLYEDAVTELAGWALVELSRVRSSDDATA